MPTGAQPYPQRLLRPRHDQRVDEGSPPVRARPGDPVVLVGGDQQVELGAEERVVVADVEVEQREGDVGGSASGHHPDPSGGDRRGGGQLLEHPQRVVGGQHGDGGAQPDPSRGGRACSATCTASSTFRIAWALFPSAGVLPNE